MFLADLITDYSAANAAHHSAHRAAHHGTRNCTAGGTDRRVLLGM
jgi:hypothetical protein